MKMDISKNIFVSHYHADADSIEGLKSLLSKNGLLMKDGSIYEAKNPNNANNEDYIKSLITPHINWAGTMIVLIGKNTSKSAWVNWEIKFAAQKDKRIIGVYLRGQSDEARPEQFDAYGDSLVKWNGKSIIDAINGNDTWEGPERQLWDTPRVTCYSGNDKR